MSGLTIEHLRELFESGSIIWTDHIHKRLHERKLSREDIHHVLLGGHIIEQYPGSFPQPSCLISGNDLNGNPLHIVMASNGVFGTMITAYYPDFETFENDLETRKEHS